MGYNPGIEQGAFAEATFAVEHHQGFAADEAVEVGYVLIAAKEYFALGGGKGLYAGVAVGAPGRSGWVWRGVGHCFESWYFVWGDAFFMLKRHG